MSVKLQINSLEVLERLIGGDSQVEIDIRNNIVQEFTKKYLKALVNNNLETQKIYINSEIRNKLDEVIFEHPKTKFYVDYKSRILRQEVKENILNEFKEAYTREMKPFLEDLLVKTLNDIDIKINDRISSIDQKIEEMIEKKQKEFFEKLLK